MKKTDVTTKLLGFIFFFSGFSSLIYQVVWQRLLTVHYGVGAIAISLIVSVYMFGLGLGALLGGYLAERTRKRVPLYFFVELLLGCFGLVSLHFLDVLGTYTAGSNYIVALICMLFFLSFPTLLMGITLPLLTKIFNNIIQDFLRSVSFLYFINTLGAGCGAVLASYGAISFFGLDSAVYIAVFINFTLALFIFITGRISSESATPKQEHSSSQLKEPGLGNSAFLCVFVTGFIAIGYEIVWFRVIGVLIKDSPYGFSTVLFVYLMGIAIGSFAMNKYVSAREAVNQKVLFFRIQFFIGTYVLLIFSAYYYLTKDTAFCRLTQLSFSSMLHPPLLFGFAPTFNSLNSIVKYIFTTGDVVFWPCFFVFVPTLLMGASFPLISSLALSQHDKEGKTVGAVYFFNVAGNVLGGIVTGFLLLAYWGSEVTLLVFSLTGIFFLLFADRGAIKRNASIVALFFILSLLFFPKSGQLFQTIHIQPGREYTAYMEEGIDGIIMTYVRGERVINYINGSLHGGRPGYCFYINVMKTCSYAPKAKNALVIGYGTGSIVEALLKIKDIETITLVELSGTLLENLKKIPLFAEMLSDPRLRVITDDGRRFLLRTDEKFDLIFIDPLRATTAYSNNIYSKQFFELASKHLNDSGVFFAGLDDQKVIPRTIASVFNHVKMFTGEDQLYSMCIAANSPLQSVPDREHSLYDLFSEKDRQGIRAQLNAPTYSFDRNDIMMLTSGYPLNQDWEPICEYYLGREAKNAFMKKHHADALLLEKNN